MYKRQLHGDNLGIAAAGSTALDAEYRAERGLTQGDDSLLADAGHRLAQTYGSGGFALTGGSGVDVYKRQTLASGTSQMYGVYAHSAVPMGAGIVLQGSGDFTVTGN